MSIELLVDLDDIAEADFASYLSSDDEPCRLPSPISELRRRVIEPINQFSYVAIIINLIYLVEQHMIHGAAIHQKISVIVLVLDSWPELNDLRNVHWSTTEQLYKLAINRKLDYVRQQNQPRCCAIL